MPDRARPRPAAPGLLAALRRLFPARVVPAGSFVPRLVGLEAREQPAGLVAFGADPGAPPVVRAADADTGATLWQTAVYDPAFLGGVAVAVADVTGDGTPDVVTGPGVGGGPHVKVLDGRDGSELTSILAFDVAFRGGVAVAAGDVNRDGAADLIAAAGAGGGPHVKVFDGRTGQLLRSFYAFDPAFTGGTRVTAADLNGDGAADVVVAAGAGGGPVVRVYDGATGLLIADELVGDADSRAGAQARVEGAGGQMTLSAGAPGAPLRAVTVLSLVGPAGPQGPQGPAGPAGSQGPQGPAGADGAQGPAGPAGPTGPQGPAGQDGAAGPQGPAGQDGQDGAAGQDGQDGAAGLQGPTGPQGPAGQDGAAGPQGPTGPQGPQGPTGPQGAQGPAGTNTLTHATGYQLATIADSTVVGGADIPFSNNGPSVGGSIGHTAGTTTFTVSDAGLYRVEFIVSITAGVGSQIAVAVNGTVDPSSAFTALVATGQVFGAATLQLVAGDVLTVRNNSAVPLVMALAPAVGATFGLTLLG